MADFILENNNPDFIYGKAYFYEHGEFSRFEPIIENISSKALGSFPFVQPACFFSASCLKKVGPIDTSLNITFDYDLFSRMSLSGAQFQFIPAELAIFRRQPKAKTYKYNHDWDEDRIETFSRTMRSLKVGKSLLEPMNLIGTYKHGTIKYPLTRKYSQEEKRSIIADFIHDNLYFYYADMRNFKRTFRNAQFLRLYLPEHFSSFARKYYYRSILFKNFLFLNTLWRVFSSLFKKSPKNN